MDAAIAGGGVALGRISLAERDVREGRLVMPYPIALTTDAHYRFVCPEEAELRPQVRAFLTFLRAETASLEEFRKGMIFVDAAEVAENV